MKSLVCVLLTLASFSAFGFGNTDVGSMQDLPNPYATEELAVAKFSFFLRDSDQQTLTETRIRTGDVLLVVGASERTDVALVAVINADGQAGWTRRDNLRKADQKNTVGIEKLRAYGIIIRDSNK